MGVAPAVSTATTARSPSGSTPLTAPPVVRPSGKRTVTLQARWYCATCTTVVEAADAPEERFL